MTRETNLYSPSAYVNPDLVDELASESDSELPQTKITKYPIGNIHYNLNPKRKTRHNYYPKKRLKKSAEIPVHLVPINLNLEIEGVKLVDFFTWNINESLMTPESFAQLLTDDLDTPVASQFNQQIADQIRKQCSTYAAVLENDDIDNDEDIEENELRIIIKLDINVGTLNLRDQFEWPLYSSMSNSLAPEEFAKNLSAELGLGSEFTSAIAHSIREQVYTARLNVDDTTMALDLSRFRIPPFRSKDDEPGEWCPEIKEMTEEEIEKKHKEQERNIRRMRRSTKLAQRLSITNPSSPHTNNLHKRVEIPKTTYEFYQLQKKNINIVHSEKSTTGHHHHHHHRRISSEKDHTKSNSHRHSRNERSPSVSVETENENGHQIELLNINGNKINQSNQSVPEKISLPKVHHGFGASAKIFNEDLSIPLSGNNQK